MYQSKTTIVVLTASRVTEKAQTSPALLMNCFLAAAVSIANGCEVDVVSVTVQPVLEEEKGAIVVYNNNGRSLRSFLEGIRALLTVTPDPSDHWKIAGVDSDEGILNCDLLLRLGAEQWP